LQQAITERWRLKQRYVEQREIDKEEIARRREAQERAFSELSQVKEEVFAKEQTLKDKRETVEEKKELWEFVVGSFGDGFDKEAERMAEVNPLDLEERRKNLEEVRREYRTRKSPSRILPDFLDYHFKYLKRNSAAFVSDQVVMPDEGDPTGMSVVRFGSVFGYMLDDRGQPYIMRQTGKLGAGRYAVDPIGAEDLETFVQENLPGWIDQKEITEPVMTDVMQNANSGMLVSGEKVGLSTRLQTWLKSGGPIMIPLLLLPVWALALVFMKLIQYNRKHKSNKDLYDSVVGMLNKKEHEKARVFASKRKGVVAKVVTTCLEHSKWTRASAEKAVREILVEEAPQLDKHLATLAVIAGAAPLLGLLGTVTGMINLFEVITHYGTGDPKILAGGISEALITTQTGLGVAITILLIHNSLRNKSLHIQSEMEKNAIRILNRLWPETT
jgi:biopolymer transport protein ExbB